MSSTAGRPASAPHLSVPSEEDYALGGWSSGDSSRSRAIAAVVLGLSLLMVGTHFAQVLLYYLPAGQFKNLHLGLALVIAFLLLAERCQGRLRVAHLVLAALSLVPAAYVHLEYPSLIADRTFGPDAADLVTGVVLVSLSLLAAGGHWGGTIPIMGVVGLAYGAFGYLLPGEILYHTGIRFERLIGYASIPFFQGLLGSLTELSAGTIFIFMVFAGLLKTTGGIDFIMSVASAVGGRFRSGPAQIAVVSSGFMGMISGSTVANVASTGAFTIPLMKRVGLRPEFAGAVEAVASTGGQFTPPVMGVTAFLIVGITGIPYSSVVMSAALPALIYYGFLMAAVQIQAVKVGLQPSAGPVRVPVGPVLRRHGHLLFSVAVLAYLLVIEMPPAFAAVYASAAIVVLDTAKNLWTHRREPGKGLATACRRIVQGLDDGARNGAALAVVIAVIGIVVDILVVTGFAQKLSYLILALSGRSMWLLLILAAVACIIFGLGMPTPAAYILVSLLGAPALVELGVELLAAHMFVFYFATLSGLTPPVAVASLVAARMAGASYLKTSITAIRLGLPGFLLPFLFVARPEILLLRGDAGTQLLTAAMAWTAIVALDAGLVGFLLSPLRVWQRLPLVAAAIGVLIPGWVSSFVGMAVILALFVYQTAWPSAEAGGRRAVQGKGDPS